MIIIDYQDRRPIFEQVVERFQTLILKGALQQDEQMPSVRKLAMELSINPNTIQKAYSILEQQGYIYPIKGRGNFVSARGSLIQEKKNRFWQDYQKLIHQGNELGITQEELEAKLKLYCSGTAEEEAEEKLEENQEEGK